MSTITRPLAVLAALALTLAFFAGRGPSDADAISSAQDARTVIRLPSPAREAVLSEMRAMLEALNGVLHGMAEQDSAAMREAALRGGTAIAVDADPEVMRRLPEAFRQLGMSTHRDFDALAQLTADDARTEALIDHLAGLTSKCVACHASYRLQTP